jgi:hypothetical protein
MGKSILDNFTDLESRPADLGGRPPVEINWHEFDKLCALHCTQVEIAEWFGCTDDTIQTHVKTKWGIGFSEYFKKKSSIGKLSLRRKQFEMALDGSVPMAIWMGKQTLGQREQPEEPGNKDETYDVTVTVRPKVD